MATSVVFSREGDTDTFDLGHPALEKLVVEYGGLTQEQRAGLPKMLLASSALSCYAAMLSAALEARGIRYADLKGVAELDVGPNALGHGRVASVKLHFSLTLAEADKDVFARVERIMRNGCLVTASLHDGMEVSYELEPRYHG